MANEYLRRTPTSAGNRKTFTISLWIKKELDGNHKIFCNDTGAGTNNGSFYLMWEVGGQLRIGTYFGSGGGWLYTLLSNSLFRDYGSWFHLCCVVDTTRTLTGRSIRSWINGVEVTSINTYIDYPFSHTTNINFTQEHRIGATTDNQSYNYANYFDFFFVDGQALTPDVFGFYKPGKGYISAGSTTTDFRPGQWVPKTPRVIKAEVNRRGGFGFNGFYLPLNDSNNFGADFHCDPNSIIKLNEDLQQPKVGIATTASAGIGYTNALRVDPYAANLVLALPFVTNGLNSGFGDYTPSIRGSGTQKTITTSNVSIASTASYYGSANFFNGTNGNIEFSGSDFNFGTNDFTVEMWVNSTTGNGTRRNLYWGGNAAGADATANLFLEINASNQLRFGVATNGSYSFPSGGSISLNQWNHIAVVKRRTTVTGYLNGVAVGVDTNCTGTVNTNANPVQIGGVRVSNLFGGYIQDLRIYNGVAKYSGGFDVPKPYTPVGIATWRAVPDTTANNFATMNALIEARPSSGTDSPASSSIISFAGGSLDLTNSASSGNAQRMVSFATIGISTGRWYWEVRADSNSRVGLSKGFQQRNYGGNLGSGSGLEATVTYEGGGTVSVGNTAYYSTATTLSGPTFDTTNIIGVAVSANSGTNNLTVQWFRDGVSVATLTGVGATSPVLEWFPSKMMMGSGSGNDQKFNFGQNPTFSGNVSVAGTFTDSNGQGLFKYQPPSGFLALCTKNLPTPTIPDPGKYFKTVTYNGSGSARNIIGLGFQPDLVWIKSRSVTANNHVIFDSVRGAASGGYLQPAQLNGEATNSTMVLSFDPDGFSLGSDSTSAVNSSSFNYVAWCWRAGAGTTSINTDGSIQSVVSVNQTAGFSIVSYTGNGVSNATVGHGLGRTPSLIIHKNRDGSNSWLTFHKGANPIPNPFSPTTWAVGSLTSGAIQINLTSAGGSYSMDAQTNGNGARYIAYCWAEIEGFSKFGSYVGNGNADGPMIWCGFKPALVILKIVTGTTENWSMFDNARDPTNNDANLIIYPNLTNGDSGDSMGVDKLSNGFKIRNATGARYNQAGYTYAFAAWAESPFITANAK